MEKDSKQRFVPFLLVIGLAVAVRLAAFAVVPMDTTPWSDSSQYINLAGSIADGTGYQLSEGNFWPGKPTIVRAPGWPLLLSLPFKVVPREWRWKTARVMALVFDVFNALIMMTLVRAMGGAPLAAGFAGGLYALNPVSAALVAQAGSEPCGITFLLLFLLFGILARGRKSAAGDSGYYKRSEDRESGAHVVTGVSPVQLIEESVETSLCQGYGGYGRYLLPGLMLGLACLVRANWLAIAGCFGLAFCWVNRSTWKRAMLQMAIFGLAVMISLVPWIARNYMVFHHFPILGAGGGETFYGGNNELAADRHSPMWGYIVQPGGIPGAVPLSVLASKMNEYEVDKYWMNEGWSWVKANPGKLPGLVAGKLRRAFVPIPYNSRSSMVLVASAYRAFLYAATVVGLILIVRRKITMPSEVWLLFGAVAVSNVLTAVLF